MIKLLYLLKNLPYLKSEKNKKEIKAKTKNQINPKIQFPLLYTSIIVSGS